VAIEARDPTTAGHSGRVADYTVGLAQAVEAAPPPALRGLSFRPDDLRQMRYAALLHDFGKVGVREHVLVKADKLYPHERDLVQARFDLIRARLDLELAEARADGRTLPDAADRIRQLEEFWKLVVECNKPTVLDEDRTGRLRQMAGLTWMDMGKERPYLTSHELKVLSIPRGSLSEDERREIESHVTHSFRFLSQIPWTRNLRRVPEIAYAHHEKLNGRGYPRGVPAEEIPVESRIMTITDIFDALTAADRPYKRALPVEKALDILQQEAKGGMLDPSLLGIFVDSGGWKAAHPR
jgi:HD-GYP domain-containing protein (c-di-GMP phosphodiesterase class II)